MKRKAWNGGTLRHAQFVLRSLVASYPSDVRVVHVFLTPLWLKCCLCAGRVSGKNAGRFYDY